MLDDVWPRVLAAGADVILDFGFWSREDRDRARGLAATVGATHRLYWVRCSDELALERVRTRNCDPGDSWFLDEGSFEYLRGKYHPLEADERTSWLLRKRDEGLRRLPQPAPPVTWIVG